MTITAAFTAGMTDHVDKLNAMVAQINSENTSTRGYVDNQVVWMQDIRIGTQASAASAAASAASAASVVQQDLSVIDKTIFPSGNLVAATLYDTSKDTDGGAWRKRCAHTSWENETLCGNWLGSAANEAAARALTGATTGSYYYDTTAGVFYKLNAGSGVTGNIFRGNARQFPAQALITVETFRAIIWDITQAGCPMWMVLGTDPSANWWASTSHPSSVAIMNGTLVVTGVSTGVRVVNFIADTVRVGTSGDGSVPQGNIAARNATPSWSGNGRHAIVDNNCNGCSITVEPAAPIDAATGLPTPTIAAATNGGVSVIKPDGNVWDWLYTGFGYMQKVWIKPDGSLMASGGGNVAYKNWFKTSPLTADSNAYDYAFDATTTPTRPGLNSSTGNGFLVNAGASRAWAGASLGVALLRDNPAASTSGMMALITSAYSSGWLPGDIRGAWLSSTAAETLTGSELVTNGTFDADTTGWTASGATFVQSAGAAVLTNSGAAGGYAYQAISTVAGQTYTVSADLTLGTAPGPGIGAGSTAAGSEFGYITRTTSGELILTFTATGTTTYITCSTNSATSGHTATFDNVLCRVGDADRCVIAKGLKVFGSVTKAAVAAGAQLVGYSGFSAANYLEQPHSAQLDFGTGDFCYSAWLKTAANPAGNQLALVRGAYSGSWSGSGIQFGLDATYNLFVSISDDGFTTADSVTTSQAVNDGAWHQVVALVRSATLELWLDGKKIGQTAVSNANLGQTNTSATTRIGLSQAGVAEFGGSIALVRTAAYAPSADQIVYMYETEKALFVPNAQCCLAGTSNAVMALAHDDETNLLHAGTSWGRSAFNGLVRVASEATPVGAINSLAASGGIIAQTGSTAADIYVPAYQLREELAREAEQKRHFGAQLVAHEFDAATSQVAFVLPLGWRAQFVYSAGALKREGSTKDYTKGFDGFRETVTFATAPGNGVWVSILAARTL